MSCSHWYTWWFNYLKSNLSLYKKQKAQAFLSGCYVVKLCVLWPTRTWCEIYQSERFSIWNLFFFLVGWLAGWLKLMEKIWGLSVGARPFPQDAVHFRIIIIIWVDLTRWYTRSIKLHVNSVSLVLSVSTLSTLRHKG